MTHTMKSPTHAPDLKRIKSEASTLIVDFEEEALRNTLIRAASDKLSQVADSSSHAMSTQVQAIRKSVANFESILSRMDLVQSNVQ